MKILNSPSLFSLLLWACVSLAGSYSATSQHELDSIDFYGKMLLNPNQQADITAAFNYYEKAYLADLKRQDTLSAIIKLRTMSIGQSSMGAIHESETSAIKALRLVDALPTNQDTRYAKHGVYIDLGKVYRNLNSPANAIRYYNRALEISINAYDSLMVINNKGNVFADIGNYGLAQIEFTSAYEKSLTLSDSLIQAKILDNLGFAQSKTRDPNALASMLPALAIRLQAGDLPGIYSSYRHLALHHHDRNQKEEALDYAKKAYLIAKTINSPSFIKNSLTNLLKIKGDSTAKEFIKLNDSIERAKLNVQNKYAAMQYDIVKEKEKTEVNKLLKEQEKRKKQAFQFLGIFLIIALVAYYFIQKSLNKRKTLQQVYITETRISKKVHDEVANDVYHLMNRVQLHSLNEDLLLDDLEKIYKKTRDISRENSELTIDEDFTKQLSDLLQSYQYEGTVITIQNISKINWKTCSVLKKTSIYRILQELMTNMKKHSKCTHVLLSFEHQKNKIQINYRDNGVGSYLESKNGLQNMESRINVIKGSITFDTAPNKGFKATIII